MSTSSKKKECENSYSCESVVISISTSILEEMSTSITSCQTSESCIYPVPRLLRRVKPEAYTPIMVSIGPFHHKDEQLIPMNVHKLAYLKSFIDHWGAEADLGTCLEIIKGKEGQIRSCYAKPIDMKSEEFIRMILIDSVFIIELFRTSAIILPFTYGELEHDLRLAENQLPFFILRDLYQFVFNPAESNSTPTSPTLCFTNLAWKWLGVDKSKVALNTNDNEADPCCHILDLLRCHYLPSQPTTSTEEHLVDTVEDLLCPTAMSLHEAGVKFCVKGKETPCSLLEIHFDEGKGTLNIPKLEVTDSTESWLRNMIAFEQCHYSDRTDIANYLFFMDCLINTGKDVQLLSNAGIIDNRLGSEAEVADLINSLCTHVYNESGDYASTNQQIYKYCKKRLPRYRAILMHNYFKHPWAILSVIYAAILLLLTIIQVVTGILAL